MFAPAADLAAPTKMASVIVTFRVMPESPDTNIKKIEEDAVKLVKEFGAMSVKTDVQPFAFGLKALTILFVINEAKGDTEELEKKMLTLEGVQGVEVTDVRRTVG